MAVAAQKDAFTGRYRKVRAPQPSELQTHISIVAYLRLMAKRGVIFAHAPNGEIRDKRTAAKLKAMGVLPGFPDLVLINRAGWTNIRTPEVVFIEIKSRGKKQSDVQKSFEETSVAAGCNYYVVRSVDDVRPILDRHGMLKGRVGE